MEERISAVNQGFARQLWDENQDLIQASLNHPFVQGIGDGSLPRERFVGYVAQDAFFLEAFARAYCIAAARSADRETILAFHHMAKGALDELNLHDEYAKRWDIDVKNVKPRAATRRYTDFLLATAWNDGPAVTAAAMTPCMRLYAYIGQQLAKDGIPDHPLSDWIRTYSVPEFDALASHLEQLTDQLVTDTEAEAMRQAYRYAMDCELGFFEAGWSATD